MSTDDEVLSARLERLSVGGRRRTKSRSIRPTRPTVAFKCKCPCPSAAAAPCLHVMASAPVPLALPVAPMTPETTDRLKGHRLHGDLRSGSVQRDLRALVLNCDRLRISDEGIGDQKNAPSCSQQALNPPCDVTIDELASYFETFVHIPKKMTTMAEMMYT